MTTAEQARVGAMGGARDLRRADVQQHDPGIGRGQGAGGIHAAAPGPSVTQTSTVRVPAGACGAESGGTGTSVMAVILQ